MKKIKAITASLIMLVGILTLAFGSQDLEAMEITETVRKPVPKLCDSETRFWTDCSGKGNGCDPMDCDGNDGPEEKPKTPEFTF